MNKEIASAIIHDTAWGFCLIAAGAFVILIVTFVVLFLMYTVTNHPLSEVLTGIVLTFVLILISWSLGAIWRSIKGDTVKGYITRVK